MTVLHCFRMIGHKHLEQAIDPGSQIIALVRGVEVLFHAKKVPIGRIHVRLSPVMPATTFDFVGESK